MLEKRFGQIPAGIPPTAPPAGKRAVVATQYGKLPLSFEVNEGQTDGRVRFFSRGSGYSLFLTENEAVIALRRASDAQRAAKKVSGRMTASPRKEISVPGATIRMELAGTDGVLRPAGEEELPGKANYFIGNDPGKWRTNVPTYAKVRYAGVYPGVDLVYYGNQGRLEYDFIVAPGTDARKIGLKFRGAEKLNLDEQGNLLLGTDGEDVRLEKPVVYQVVDGARRAVEGGYTLIAGTTVRFEVGEYDHSKPLVIDPVLAYSTYLGGSGYDSGNGIAVDSAGNAYVLGSTGSANFPKTAGVFQPTLHTSGQFSSNAFVTKLNASGSALLYSTYLGGSNNDKGFGIAVDSAGNVYLTGATQSSNFPTTAGAIQHSLAGVINAFITKLNASGSALVYSTYLGGSNQDQGNGIAVDSAGNATVTGTTGSTNFPTANALHSSLRGPTNAFVTKVNPGGSALIYSSYLGGSNRDSGQGIAVDPNGNAYVTGQTTSTDFPTTAGVFQPTLGGVSGVADAFVTELSPSGSALVYSTYLSIGSTMGRSIALDSSGNAYVTGSAGPNFPTTAGAFQPSLPASASFNAFVTKLNSSGSALIYSTYLGGSNNDSGTGIALDSAGNAYVTGSTNSTNFPVSNAFQPFFGGGFSDAFVAKLNPNGSALVYSTYLGGSNQDQGNGIAVDSGGNAYVAGTTSSSDFPTSNAFQGTFGGGGDAFVAKLSAAAVQQGDFSGSFDHGTASATLGGQATYVLTVTPSGGFTGDVALRVSNLPPGVTGGFSPSVITGGSGTSTLTLTAATSAAPGIYDFIVTGNSGPLVHSTTLTVLVGTADFTGSVTPTYQGVAPGGSAQYVVTLHTLGTIPFNNTVTLTMGGLPAGVTGSFNPPTINPDTNGSSTLTLTTTSGTPQGSFQINLTGTGGGQVHSTNIVLAVSNSSTTGDFSGSFDHSAASTNSSGQAFYSFTMTPSGGFNGNVALTVSNLPSGASGSFSPAVMNSGSRTSTLTVDVRGNSARHLQLHGDRQQRVADAFDNANAARGRSGLHRHDHTGHTDGHEGTIRAVHDCAFQRRHASVRG